MSKVIVPRHPGVVRNGAVQHFQPQRWQAACMALEGKRVFTAVAEFEERRSIQANKYYWVMMTWLTYHDSQFFGWTKDMVHYYFGLVFNPYPTGDPKNPIIPGETKNMTKEEFAQRIELVKAYEATEKGIYVPDQMNFCEV